jgi:hypothetical protein
VEKNVADRVNSKCKEQGWECGPFKWLEEGWGNGSTGSEKVGRKNPGMESLMEGLIGFRDLRLSQEQWEVTAGFCFFIFMYFTF